MTSASNLDLTPLVRQKTPAAAPRRSYWRLALVSAVLFCFAALMVWSVRDWWTPARSVTVVPVLAARTAVQRSGESRFQAAGWIEPRPSALLVSAQTAGIVEKVLVVEGEEVKPGQPLAQLFTADAELARSQAAAEVELRAAEVAQCQTQLTAARARFEQPTHLTAALAEAESLLAKSETEQAKLPFEIRTAEANRARAKADWEGKQAAGEAIAGRALDQARRELEIADAACAELTNRPPLLESEVAALKRRVAALHAQREARVEETRALGDAEAQTRVAAARLEQAKLAAKAAELRCERLTVRAPSAGRVLELLAHSGTPLSGQTGEGAGPALVVASLYDPRSLQVRVDVRFEDLPLVEPGQSVRIEAPAAGQPLRGRVLLPTSRANVQKNTLEVKVALEETAPNLRPEMLVQATFLAAESAGAGSAERERLLVPRQLVEVNGHEGLVWLAGPDGRAHRQTIQLGGSLGPDLVEATGLDATAKLIVAGRETLIEGERIRITAEDSSLGLSAGPAKN